MAKTIDITSKLTSERPTLKISEDKTYTIDHSKNTVLAIQQLIDEAGDFNIKGLEGVLELALGKEAATEINEMDISFSDYTTIFIAVMAGAMNEDYETVEARFRSAIQT